MTERIYSPDSVVRNPVALVRQMLRDAKAARYLAWRILVRDLKARYRQTLLGSLWIFIPPVFIAIGLTLATRTKVIQIAATDIPYAAYVIFSMSLWFTFVEAVNGPLNVIEQSRSLLARISFPHEALLIARFADVFVNFLVRVLLVIGVLLLFNIDLSPRALAAIPAALAVILFGFTIGLTLAPFATLYHDISKGTAIVLYLMLFLTPVIYPRPTGDNMFAAIVNANPLTPMIMTVRELATGAALTAGGAFLALTIVAVLGFFFAWLLYKVSLPFVIERLSA
jgi:lipopolysaccharide transport system permease protein